MGVDSKNATGVVNIISNKDGVTVNGTQEVRNDDDLRHYAGIASTDESYGRGGYRFELKLDLETAPRFLSEAERRAMN